MRIIDGKKLALEIRTKLKEKITKLGFTPGLGVILVGNDPSSHLYVRLKEKACAEVGIRFEKKIFPENAKQNEIIKTIQQYNHRADLHGILVQIPLPKNFKTDKIISTINPQKDVDGFHPANLALLRAKEPKIIPGVSLGIMELIKSTKIDLKNKKAVLLVNSEIFALPIKYLLEKKGVKTKIVLQATSYPAPEQARYEAGKLQVLKDYDIVVIALGQPNFLKADAIKNGAIIIDVGTTKVDGHLTGDADFESFRDRKVFITPVPGGVGPMTVAMLLQNIYTLAKN